LLHNFSLQLRICEENLRSGDAA
jgi:hypothetical protein